MLQNLQLNMSSGDEQRKLPSLRKVFMEAMEMRRLQRFLEPIRQLLVEKKYELALEKIYTIVKWNSENEIQASESGNLKLQFLSNISLLVFTGIPISGEGTTLKVALLDALTGKIITSGPEASATLEIVVLDKDFCSDEDGNWTLEEFNSKVVSESEAKKPSLGGNYILKLKEGIGSLDNIFFRHTNIYMRRNEFRLGARVVDHLIGRRIKEALTEPFTVKDRRVKDPREKLNKKHYLPSLSDEVWVLENIGKDGPFHRRLIKENIRTVKDFLDQYLINPEKLQHILGARMTAKKWNAVVNHAHKSKLDTTLHLPECPNACNVGTSHINYGYDPMQPSTSQCVISPILSNANTSNFDVHGLQNNGNMDQIHDQFSGVLDHGTNSPDLDWDPFFENWDENMDLRFLHLIMDDPGLESNADKESTVYAEAGPRGKRRWARICNVMRWLCSIRRVVSSKRIHVAKKQRCY